MSGQYRQVSRDYTQSMIQSLIQAVVHLKYHFNYGSKQDGFHTEFEDTKIAFFPNGIDFGLGETDKGYMKQIKWELQLDSDAKVPRVINLCPIEEPIRQRLGRVLRYWLDHTE